IHDWFIIFANYWIFKENKIATDDSKYTFRYKKDDLTGPFWTFRFKKDDLKLYYKEIQTYERILQNLIVYMVLPDGRNLYDREDFSEIINIYNPFKFWDCLRKYRKFLNETIFILDPE